MFKQPWSCAFPLFFAAVLGAGAANANDDDGDRAAFRAWPGMGLGHKVGSGLLLSPQLSFSLPLFDVLEPEVAVGIGVNATLTSLEMVNRFSFGLRWFIPAELSGAGAFDVDQPVRPFLWTALHHGHKVAGSDVLKNPIGALLTSTSAGVGHLAGAEAGIGVLLALPIDGVSWPLLLRLGASWLPSFAAVHEEHGGGGDDVLLLLDVAVGLPLRLHR